jgi:hypothetical protein
MPRLFIGNFDFEHRLAEPRREPSTKLQRLNAELASAWLAIADDGDWLWIPSPIEKAFFEQTASAGLPRMIPVISFAEVPRGVKCVPWGWSGEVRALAERFGWIANAPSMIAVRAANSRATSEELERKWNIGLTGARRVETTGQFHSAIRALTKSDARWIVKAEFGMSARERILGRGIAIPAAEDWVRRRLASHGAVFFEPWVERIDEVGIQIDVPQQGSPLLIGVTPMLVDQRGQYAGSWFDGDESRLLADSSLWNEAIEVALRVAKSLQLLDYFGPLGIDAMVYRDGNGVRRVRSLQDINARWTMGRLSLGWRRLLRPGERGCWQHGARDEVLGSMLFEPTRKLSTSPDCVGAIRCHHMSQILIRDT